MERQDSGSNNTTQPTHMRQTRAKKSLTSPWCLAQMFLWKGVFIQSSMLHTCRTRLEYQQMDRERSEAPSTKLSLLSWLGELKTSTVHSRGSQKTWRSWRQVRERLRRLSLSRKEKRCSRHSRFSWVRCMAGGGGGDKGSRPPGLWALVSRSYNVPAAGILCGLDTRYLLSHTHIRRRRGGLFSGDNCHRCQDRNHTLCVHLSSASHKAAHRQEGRQAGQQMFTLGPGLLTYMHTRL